MDLELILQQISNFMASHGGHLPSNIKELAGLEVYELGTTNLVGMTGTVSKSASLTIISKTHGLMSVSLGSTLAQQLEVEDFQRDCPNLYKELTSNSTSTSSTTQQTSNHTPQPIDLKGLDKDKVFCYKCGTKLGFNACADYCYQCKEFRNPDQ